MGEGLDDPKVIPSFATSKLDFGGFQSDAGKGLAGTISWKTEDVLTCSERVKLVGNPPLRQSHMIRIVNMWDRIEEIWR